jgi:hypothetical protein
MGVSLLHFIALEINIFCKSVCILCRNVYILHIHTLKVRMSTSDIVIHYIECCCQSPNPQEIVF